MELVLGLAIGLAAATIVLTIDWMVRAGSAARASGRANRARDPRQTLALSVGTPADRVPPSHQPDAAASTDWIRNTIGQPEVGPSRGGRSRRRVRCTVCNALIVKGAGVCKSCGALVPT